ncbi:P-loop containing nucleoside triphosphate hydrolase protein [Aspergillus avenaceus]|uniref:P-loop containing nucleoside triphosphate hydrolase protein n=1 Tax=Aspergillus avenaceus TaxID=36643 RepID=A0A5N6TE83_ASPAV|nr:P-loop containing nucleoside triphosphate hydrolase protein [Aspergillus avenaceus]
MRPKPASSLQKTYDDCYLMCSTAVYFEGQNNEEEALKSWRSALETIYYHNAYRVPSKYTPKNETEKALQESIRQLELQCRERVDLLEALRQSRKDTSGKSPPPYSNHRGWIGEGTVPAVGYTDLSKPPTIPGRPPPPFNQTSSESIGNEANSSNPMASRPVLRKNTSSSAKTSSSRTSSPERRKVMPSTLRTSDLKKPAKKKASPRRKDLRPAAASQAAGLAWGSLYRSPSTEKTVSDAALHSSRVTAANDPSFRKDPPPRSTSGGGGVPARRSAPPEDSGEDRRPGRKPRVSDQAPRRSPAKSTPAPTSVPTSVPRVSVGSRQQPASRTHSASVLSPSRDSAQPRASPRPSVKPKPMALRSSHQSQPSEGSGKTADTTRRSQPKSTSSTPRKITPASTGEDAISDGMDRMDISQGTPERRPLSRMKRTVTPPSSSDPESLGPKSTDAEEDPEVDDEDEAIANILAKLPKGVDVTAARQILNDIVVRGDEVHWDDIAGLEGAKKALKEAVVYPFLRPDLFSGLREPARGMLLFGPPGTGKTMLARAVATESKSTFFSVSASTLTSKWHGESEKLVRALFGLAKALAPSIIFVDEIDSLLSARSSGTENEASRRSKTEFLIQWSDLQRAAAGREQSSKDKKASGDASRVLVLAATNMPWDIDEAARRRFVRRQYIPLPEHHVREQQLRTLLSHQVHDLTDQDITTLVEHTEGFSGSDITALAKDAAMGPLRNLGEALLHTPMDQIRPIRSQDFQSSLSSIRPSVSRDGLREYEDWARQFGERGG